LAVELPSDILREMNNPIAKEEIRAAVKVIHPDKASGGDGLSGWFYKLRVDPLVPRLTALFSHILNGASFSAEMKSRVIVTIYKGCGDPLDISNRCPSTLLNDDYKLLSRIVNARFLRFLSKLIAPNQSGFIRGQQIFDNVFLAASFFDFTRRSSQCPLPLIFFIDLEKAYDSIMHSALRRTLQHFQLPNNLINLISNMLTGAEAQVLVNEYLTAPIPIQRETRQGESLSLTFFVLGIECVNLVLLSDTHLKGLPSLLLSKSKL